MNMIFASLTKSRWP